MVGIGRQMIHLHNFTEIEVWKLEVYNIRLPLQGHCYLLQSSRSRNQATTRIIQNMKVIGQTSHSQYLIATELQIISQGHPVSVNECGSFGPSGKEQFIIVAKHKYIHRFNLWIECIRILHIIVECEFQPDITPGQVLAYAIARSNEQY